ncbi:unnamed protein product [Oppiella nova]|uniref:Uncharacterized protein n=1 Tax=Oppiella nova TaxID=334625 RepID=A0A7R9MFB3_9ACAR|nr:unnamed protein product [Oppiella nova]CAD7659172.1 unnamed protein product [Oppiella nova]CAG2167661.1 unnamed protein product [Oppiella nova]CAG2176334.1 unnamed protein product [Oppiella nova]
MAKLLISLTALLALVVIYTSAQDMSKIFTEEVRKNAKMIMCGTCKDETVRGDIMKFGQCVQTLYPKEFAKILSIREAQMSNPDECIKQMRTELEGYARADPSGAVKVMDCFRANVVPDHLAKCH